MSGNHGAAEQSRYFAGYEILSTLGQGGMGIVYEARDPALGRIVALKVLRDDLQARPHLVSRFNREAQAIARLNHPNIVHVFSVGAEKGIPYIAMEYIDGAPLSMVMQRERRLSWDRSLDIAGQIADALASAHDAQIIHRDIKPGNILIDESNHVYVTDFGIAKILTAETQLTADGSLLGTPQYMAPERCQNGEASAASDIYSLGILTFQMVSGRLPFEAATPVDLVRKIVSEPPVRLRQIVKDVPEDVDRLVAFMMEKKAKDRPSSSRVLCDAIARVRSGEPLDTHGGEVAAALASFRDTMATPTPRPGPQFVNSATTEERLGQGLPRERRKRFGGRAVLGVVVAALLALTAFMVGRPWDGRVPWEATYSPEQGAQRWQTVGAVAEFVDEAPGVVLARLALGAFTPDVVTACAGTTVFVQLTGAPGSGREGQSALVSVEPMRRTATLEAAPMVTLGKDGNETIRLLAGEGGASQSASLRHDAILWRRDATTSSSRTSGGLASWDIQAHTPRYPVFQASENSTISAAAVKNTGSTLALGVASADGTCYLAEYDLRSKDLSALGTALTDRGAPIVKIVYSQDGTQVVFVRDLGNHRRQVWIASTVASAGANRLLADGAVDVGPNAFSADGGTLIVSEALPSGRSLVRLVRVKDGTTETELGEGWMAGWGGSGDRIVVTAADAKGRCQLWAVASGTSGNSSRTQLTFLEAGTSHAFCVSGDGAWAVSSLAGGPQATLVFVELAKAAS